MSINRVTISGNIGGDPELRSTSGGMSVLKFSVAVNERVKNGDQWEDRANWVDCTMFGTRAESVSRFISKGSKVAIEGKLRYSSWETEDGGKRSKLEVIVDEIEFMSRSEAPVQPNPAPNPHYPQTAPQAQPYDPYGADIAF